MPRIFALAIGFSLAALVISIAAMLAGVAIAGLTGGGLPAYGSLALGVSGPAVAALIFAMWFGKESHADLRRRLVSVPRLPALAIIPIAYALVAITAANLSGGDVVLLDTWALVTAIAVQFAVVALLEEIGWRGWLTPVLLERCTPLTVSLVVSLGWFVWHAPKFAVGPTFVGLLFVGCVAHSIIMTAMMADRRAGFWACVILHGSVNLSQVVIDPDLSSLSSQYAAFGAAVGLSCVFAIVVFCRRFSWFVDSAVIEPRTDRR